MNRQSILRRAATLRAALSTKIAQGLGAEARLADGAECRKDAVPRWVLGWNKHRGCRPFQSAAMQMKSAGHRGVEWFSVCGSSHCVLGPSVRTALTMLGIALLLSASFLFGASNARADVPEIAQFDFAEGVRAASRADYASASEHFRRAYELAPDAGAIHFNLGLSEAQLAGHELSAMCWLGAYLAGAPGSPLTPSVEGLIETLKAQHKQDLARMVEVYQNVANLRQEASFDNRDYALYRTGMLWVRLHELERAKLIATQMAATSNRASKLNQAIARGFADEGSYVNEYQRELPTDGLFSRRERDVEFWRLLTQWVFGASGSILEENQRRAVSWTSTCTTILSVPIWSDNVAYFKSLTSAPSLASPLLRPYDLTDQLEYAIRSNIAAFDEENRVLREMHHSLRLSWAGIYTLVVLALLYAAVIVAILLDILFARGRHVSMPVTVRNFLNAIVLTPIGMIAVTLLSAGVVRGLLERTPGALAEWVGLIIGTLLGGAFLFSGFIATAIGLVMILTKPLGVAKEGAKQ